MSHFLFYSGPKVEPAFARLKNEWPDAQVVRGPSCAGVWRGPNLATEHGPESHSPEGQRSHSKPGLNSQDPHGSHRRDPQRVATTGYLAAGVGLRKSERHYDLLGGDDWSRLLSEDHPDLSETGGHFVIVRWGPDGVWAATDRFGVRSLYFSRWHDGLLLCTDLPSIARITENGAPDPVAFGSHWLLQNQLGTGALTSGLERLCGERLVLDAPGRIASRSRIIRTSTPRTPGPPAASTNHVQHELRIAVSGNRSLGLSGGLDSRLLLAAGNPEFLHVFGHEQHPDVVTARRLATLTNREIRWFRNPSVRSDGLVEQIDRLAADGLASSPASSVLSLMHYPDLATGCEAIVDGGFGEIGRRVFFGRLLRKGPLHNLSASDRMDAVRFRRPAFLSTALTDRLTAGAEEAVEHLLPPQNTASDADFADRTGLAFRLPNFFGYEQGRLDGLCRLYMPYAQPDVVDALLGLSINQRKNGRFFKSSIRDLDARLSRISLVKSGGSYPFGLHPAAAYFWAKLRKSRVPDVRGPFLRQLRPYLRQRARDADVLDCGWYDTGRLQVAADHAGDGGVDDVALDWWLALDAWRRATTA